MPGTPLRLGPFKGLNTSSDPSIIGDDELVECINLNRDIDGSLTSRPPIQTGVTPGGTTQRLLILGAAVFTSGTYLIGSNSNGCFYNLNGNGAWIQFTAAFQASSMVQYNDRVFLLSVPDPLNSLAQWDPTGGFVLLNPANLQTMMGATSRGGGNIMIYKDRLFIVPGAVKTTLNARLIFSDEGNPAAYATVNQYIEVRPGDGQRLIDMAVFEDNLMLFKSDSTWALSFTGNPDSDQLVNVNNTIGVTAAHCIAQYENALFTYYEGSVYQIINYAFSNISEKLQLFYDPSSHAGSRLEPIFLSVFDKSIIFRYFNIIYVYQLQTNTWSTWESASPDLNNFGPLTQMPSNALVATAVEYYAGSSAVNDRKTFLIKTDYTATDVEQASGVPFPITCSVRTKNFDLATSHQYKRLWHWGADVLTSSAVIGDVTPIVSSFSSTWGQVFASAPTWSSLQTWGNPLVIAAVTTMVSITTGLLVRRYVRFAKGLRYRQVNFRISFSTGGSTLDGPCKLFSITMFTSARQLVEKASN